MSGNSKKLIAFNYLGGKFTYLEHLYAYFPNDIIHLVDLLGGSFSVSLNYKGKCVKTANEINGQITNFFQVLRDHENRLIELLELTPVSKNEYNNCWTTTDCNIENARRFYVRVRQSFFSLGASNKNKGWQMAKTQYNSKGGENVSKWNNSFCKLRQVAKILRQQFQITNFDALECIDRIDFDNAFFYVDPPYTKRSRGSYNDYKFEFSDDQHADLAKCLHNIKGKAMISGYNCSLMNELYHDWEKIPLPVKKNNIRSKEVREFIWINYPTNQLKIKF